MNDGTNSQPHEEGWLRRWQGQPRVVQMLGFLGLFVLIACLGLIVDHDLSLGKGLSSSLLMASLQGW